MNYSLHLLLLHAKTFSLRQQKTQLATWVYKKHIDINLVTFSGSHFDQINITWWWVCQRKLPRLLTLETPMWVFFLPKMTPDWANGNPKRRELGGEQYKKKYIDSIGCSSLFRVFCSYFWAKATRPSMTLIRFDKW